MSYFQYHVFFCVNQRAPGEACCNNHGASEMRAYAKDCVKKLKLAGHGKVRINSAGCLDRCEEGPCVVVYPDGVWYTYVDESDIDEIIEEHRGGKIVVFSHTGTICILALHLMGALDAPELKPVWISSANCGITKFELRDEGFVRVLVVNDTSHLPKT